MIFNCIPKLSHAHNWRVISGRVPKATKDRVARAQDGAIFGQGLIAGRQGRGAEFAVDFVGIGVGQQLIEQLVGAVELEDLIGGQEWRQAFLPVVVATFDLAFGLGCWGVTEIDAVEVEGSPQLGEGVGVVGVEEGVVVHVEGQGQAVGLEDGDRKSKWASRVSLE